jgi:hypothetical protein
MKPKIEYKQVDTSTLKGLKEAERLHANGWKIIRTGLFTIQFCRITERQVR